MPQHGNEAYPYYITPSISNGKAIADWGKRREDWRSIFIALFKFVTGTKIMLCNDQAPIRIECIPILSSSRWLVVDQISEPST